MTFLQRDLIFLVLERHAIDTSNMYIIVVLIGPFVVIFMQCITLTKRYHTFGTISGQLLRDGYNALNSYSIINITFFETSCIIRLLPLTNELRS